jgi:hypothetical protein
VPPPLRFPCPPVAQGRRTARSPVRRRNLVGLIEKARTLIAIASLQRNESLHAHDPGSNGGPK